VFQFTRATTTIVFNTITLRKDTSPFSLR